MKLAVAGGKGGTGKSTIATMMAAELATKERAMLIDCDVECPNDHLLLGLETSFYKDVFQVIPKWDMEICKKCGKCADVCKQGAIIYVKNKYPAFLPEKCIGCTACVLACPYKAITTDKRAVGKIYFTESKEYNICLVTGELNIGDLASGEIVAEVRKESLLINESAKCQHIITDAAAGIGCPVIASIVDNDFVIAVTEPTPSAFSDLKRIVSLATHFSVPIGIVVNKFDIDPAFTKKIEDFAKNNKAEILGKMPYDKEFIKSSAKAKISIKKEHRLVIKDIINKIGKVYEIKR